ncbi:tyrosine-type recombinase/integrase [Vibrio alfacsensis]|uniref:tyrosine-type recombinase/integrase n=1 Tax=Vibrio alfacsensis TaxID=1074311 RepID=UPI004068A682
MPALAKPLTNSAIKKALPKNGKEQTLTDAGNNRLICRIRSTQAGKVIKTFCFRCRHSITGKMTKITIGAYPETTLEEARTKAAELFIREENNTLLPLRTNNREQFVSHSIILSDAFDIWLKTSNGSKEHKTKVLQRYQKHVSKSLGNIPVHEITTPRVANVLDRLFDNGLRETCKRILSNLIATFDYLVNNGILQYNCLTSLRRNYRSSKKQSFKAINESELPELLKAITTSSSYIETKCLMLFQLHTMNSHRLDRHLLVRQND